MSTPIVHIVDDDELVRNALPRLLQPSGLEVRVYSSGEEFLQDLDPLRVGCLVTDLRMPGMSGLDILEHLRASQNDIPAIVITGHADVPATLRCMKLGAIDLLQKPIEPLALLTAIENALQKSGEDIQRKLEHNRVQRVLADLTHREQELLRLIAVGRSNKQIAMDLQIALNTVINHRAHLMHKTHAANAADLARIATVAGVLRAK